MKDELRLLKKQQLEAEDQAVAKLVSDIAPVIYNECKAKAKNGRFVITLEAPDDPERYLYGHIWTALPHRKVISGLAV